MNQSCLSCRSDLMGSLLLRDIFNKLGSNFYVEEGRISI